MTDISDWEQTLFQLILHAGSARSFAKEAAEFAESCQWEDAEKSLQQANDEQTQAHKINTAIITRAARGEDVPFSVLLVHSLDLLMLAWSEIDYTESFIRMSKRIEALEKEVSECQNQLSKK
jgi:PTS system cellobiose-specific IIA component